jgi:hypothetical protein
VTLVEDYNSDNKDVRAFRVPSSLLNVGVVYTVTITAALVNEPGVQNSASVMITLDQSDVVARIAGGGSRVVGAADTVVVSAACSFDPDGESGHAAVASGMCDALAMSTITSAGSADRLSFIWTCTDQSTGLACVSTEDASTPILLPTTPVLTLNNRTAGMASSLRTGSYTIAVTVCAGGSKEPCARNATTSSDVLVIAGDPPSVRLTACFAAVGESTIRCGQPVPSRVNPTDRLVLDGIVTTASSDSVLVDVNGTASVALEWTEHQHALHDTPEYFGSGLDRTSLVVKAGSLAPRSAYTFRLSATDRMHESTGYAEVTVLVNAPPTSGEVRVASCDSDSDGSSSCSGTAVGFVLETVFEVSAVYWTDDADDLPLRFEFNYLTVANGVSSAETPMGYLSSSNSIRSQLPEGNVTVVVRVYDRMMASATATATTVRVTQRPDVTAVSLVSNGTQKVLEQLAEGGSSGEEALRSISLMGSMLNTEQEETKEPTAAPTRAPTVVGDTSSPTAQPTGVPTLNEAAAAAEAERVAKELEERQQLREQLLQVTLDAQAYVDPSPRSMQQQTACIDTLTAVPTELSSSAQHSALAMLSTVVNETKSRSMAIEPATVQAIGRSISSVIEAGILSSDGTPSEAADDATDDSSAAEETGGAAKVVMGTLGTLSRYKLFHTALCEVTHSHFFRLQRDPFQHRCRRGAQHHRHTQRAYGSPETQRRCFGRLATCESCLRVRR